MTYQLSETDKAQLRTLREQIFLQYNEEDALKMEKIIARSLPNGWMDKDDVYELIDVLPRIILSPKEEPQIKPESQNLDWNVYIDERRARYKHEMERLHQTLSNWVFMQSTVYRKNMEPLASSIGRAKINNMGQGIKK